MYMPNNEFTSHYVTINSRLSESMLTAHSPFTSHYVTINSVFSTYDGGVYENLHPTM